MIFVNDINLHGLYCERKLDVILVDHHSLKSKLNDLVIEIIDHHQMNKESIKLKE